jgi:hypothetical protein
MEFSHYARLDAFGFAQQKLLLEMRGGTEFSGGL